MAKFYTRPGRLPIELIDDEFTRSIEPIITSVSTVGVSATTLHTLTLPPGILSEGKSLQIISQGLFSGVLGTKRLALNQGANIIIDVAGVASNNVGWKMVTDLTRQLSGLYIVTANLFPSAGYGGGSFTAVYQGQNQPNIGNAGFDAALTFTYTGQVVNAADSVIQFSTIAHII